MHISGDSKLIWSAAGLRQISLNASVSSSRPLSFNLRAINDAEIPFGAGTK
jgi:hypothetical protein